MEENKELEQFELNDFDALPEGTFDAERISRATTTYFKDVWRTFKSNKIALVALFVMALLLIMVIIGPGLNKYDYFSNDYSKSNLGPTMDNWFGTDNLGRDLWTRVWTGGRVSLFIAVISMLVSYAIGMIIGGIAGFYGGKVDMIIMRTIDVLMGIPELVYMTLLMLIFQSGTIVTLCVAMSITGWMGPARSVRGLILQIKSRDYVVAAETLGASPARIIRKHLIPNILGILVVGMTMTIPGLIFAESFLSYIGLGVTPPNPSWGQLIKSAAANFRYYPYQFIIPCACVAATMLCCNLIGDGLRDALDPKLRGR